ncbi:MAG: oligopeptide transporter, OPT family [Deltaproteobacteria bacterium]|nr:oligopeptide transporter, OPT family [Deltaproteobacteria bacterium]
MSENKTPHNDPLENVKEFTLRALVIGLVLCVVLGAANAYLGLKAGMTIAATYPAAVIGMAVLRLFRGTLLEENMARTVGSIGESVAAGAIFTIPAFYIAKIWPEFDMSHYWESSAIMAIGGIIGILFVTMLRRVMVEDRDLPFPESVAAAEIHKAGRSGGTGAKFLFGALGVGAFIQFLGKLNVFPAIYEKFIIFSKSTVKVSGADVQGGGGALFTTPGVSPAYIGVGYIIGPRLAALNFSGGLLAWGLFVPLMLYFVGDKIELGLISQGKNADWTSISYAVWKSIVRPIAIGGMLVSAAFTLYRMRTSLINGIKRSISDLKKSAQTQTEIQRTEKDISLKYVLPALLLSTLLTLALYYYFSQSFGAALVAAIVMVIAGFFFAAVSGYLVGMIGSSNNPISGLTISTLIIAALLMVVLGMQGTQGVAAVLGVAAVICVSAAVAGEMLQDLKVGHILGGTPYKMQIGDIIGVIVAAAVMFIPLLILHVGDIKMGGTGFGGKALPAPQAGLMALLAQGIVGGSMTWPLIIVGMLMAIGLILVQVKSPMLVCVGMYLPFETTAAIFVGGLIRGVYDMVTEHKKFNDAQKIRSSNVGVLLASGLIAGEALMGLIFAGLAFFDVKVPVLFESPTYLISLLIFGIIAFILIYFPVKNAGSPDEPPPPSAVM